MAVAVAVAATSVAAAADGAALPTMRTMALVVVVLVTSIPPEQTLSHNNEAPTVFFKTLRIRLIQATNG